MLKPNPHRTGQRCLPYPFILAAAMVLGLTISAVAADAQRYNVLWIVVDDLNTDLPCYGQPLVHSPNIDKLAARGVRFDRAYCQYALCNPSRSSFLSGYRPDRTRVVEQEIFARTALPDATFLPQLFRKNGYFTAAAGKLHHGGRHIDRPSWDHYEDSFGSDPQEAAARQERNGNPDRTPGYARIDGPDEQTQDGSNARTITRFLEEKSQKDQPFFLALGLHKPHVPWTAPRRMFDRYPLAQMPRRDLLTGSDIPQIALQTEWPIGTKAASQAEGIAAYFACVSFTDANVGSVTAALDRLGLWNKTIVVFMGDHGFHLGDRGLWSKKTLFEQALRVPLIICLPNGASAGRACRRTVQLVDLYPTLADLCGLTPPADLDGKSLRPLLLDPDATWDRPAYSQVRHEGLTGRSVRTERWRYTEWDGGKAGHELYDHDLDPLELRNLAAMPELAPTRQHLSVLLSQP
jgi:iduronate 2-sulfatase